MKGKIRLRRHGAAATFVHLDADFAIPMPKEFQCTCHDTVPVEWLSRHTLNFQPNFSEIAIKALSDAAPMHRADDVYIDSLPASNRERYEVGWVPDFV